MVRPAAWRFGVVSALALVACWRGGGGSSTLENRQAVAEERDLTGAYFCTIAEDEFEYDPFPCVIRKLGGRFVLAKLGGSQRFRGEVRARGEGFTFDGERYCPWGDCTEPMRGAFRPIRGGALRARFDSAGISVTLVPAPDTAFGGVAYGGDGYGGFEGYEDGTGGAVYGGPLQQRYGRP
jgi:hypothetical protein